MLIERYIAQRLSGTKSRSFTKVILRIAAAATAVSIAVMIVSTAMITGFKKEISNKVFGFWGHIQITDTRAFSSYEAVPFTRDTSMERQIAGLGPIDYTYTVSTGYIEGKTEAGVRQLQRFAQVPGIVRVGEEMEGMILKGVADDFDWDFLSTFIREGDILEWQDTVPSDGILISRTTADRLRLQVDDPVFIHFIRNESQIQRRFHVKGIYRTGLEDSDAKYAIVDIRKVQQILGWEEDEIAGYEVFAENLDDADMLRDYIYVEILPKNLFAETIRQKYPLIFEWLDLQDINEIVILLLTLIVAMINMVTVLLILILERTHMIGVLKSVGGTNWQIRKIFLWSSGIILSRGLIIGNVLAIGLCLLQKHFKLIRLDEADYYISYAPIHLNPLHILAINGGTILLTMITLIIPSMLIMRMHPVRVLRFK